MLYKILGNDADFLTTALTNPTTGETDVDIIGSTVDPVTGTATQIVVQNPNNFHTITINGTGMAVDAGGTPIAGTITSFEVRDAGGTLVGTIDNVSWSLVAFNNALDALDANNFGPLAALINTSPTITIDATGATGVGPNGFVDTASALGNLAPFITSPVTHIGSTLNETAIGGTGNDSIDGDDGNDILNGGLGDDTINPGDNNGDGDSIEGGLGSDTIDFSDIVNGWVGLFHNDLTGPITATVNGVTNTGSIAAGSEGTDTLLDVVNPLNSGWTTGGLRINGTSGADTFDITLGNEQWMDVAGLDGNDTINLNLTGSGYARLSYHVSSGAVTADLGTGTISQDGFTDQLNLTDGGTGTFDYELRTGNGNDSILGSANDESFITRGGNDTVDGGLGYDRIRFDRSGFDAVDVDLAAGTATGTYNGNAFSHTLSNIEYVRGSRNGNDTLAGSGADETFSGRGGDDTMTGAGGDDILFGGAGNDTAVINANRADALIAVGTDIELRGGVTATGLVIDSADGTDFIVADVENIQFNDGTFTFAQLSATAGVFEVGSSGPDTLDGGANGDLLVGLNGNDVLNGNEGADSLLGDNGFDTLNGGDGNDTLLGGINADVLNGEGDDDLLQGELGGDTLDGGAGSDTLEGGDGNDSLYGGVGHDTLIGGEGTDRLYGGENDDLLQGEANARGGTERLFGEGGNDTVEGGRGFDYIDGGDGNDLLDGGRVADRLFGRAGEDTLLGGSGNDRMLGGGDDDSLNGGADDDKLLGNSGNDTLIGEDGSDLLVGGGGYDLLDGGADNDTIIAGAGADTITGGTGDDLLRGKSGPDTFVFEDGHGNDTIEDFRATNDAERIDFSGLSTINSLADLDVASATLGAATQVGADVVIDTGSGNSILLTGVTLGDLDANDFIFV